MIRIITDSSSDFSLEEARQIGCEIVALKVMDDEETYRDRIDLDIEDIYRKMTVEKKQLKTSQPSPEDFLKVFQSAAAVGDDILVLVLSKELSGTYQSAKIAESMLESKVRIEILDTNQVTLSQKLLILEAVQYRDEGKSFDEIVSHVKEMMEKVSVMAVIDTLEYLVRGGRLSKTAGFAGTLIDLKPIVTVKDGRVALIAKARGKKKALEKLYAKILEEGGIDLSKRMILIYSGSADYVMMLKEFLASKGICVEAMNPIGCVIGAHVGPGACGIAYFKK